MRILKNKERKSALDFLHVAAQVAKSSTCYNRKCGSIIVKDNLIIGKGYNSPPRELYGQRRCFCDKSGYHQKVTDKTCCIHAEVRAIFDALRNHPSKIDASRMYFASVDEEGNLQRADPPYCTLCSKLALDVGISEFVLNHKKGIYVYETPEYNDESFRFEG